MHAFFYRYRWIEAVLVTLVSMLLVDVGIRLLSPAMFFDNHGRVVYWPVDAILVAVMLMAPRRYWPWMLLGSGVSQAAENYASMRWPENLADGLGNLAETLIAAFVLPPFRGLANWMRQPRLILRYIGGAVVMAPLLPTTAYGLFYYLVLHRSFWRYAESWACADTLGMALSLPLVLVLFSHETYDLFRWQALSRTISLLGLTCGLSWMIFHYAIAPVAFVILPLLLLVAFQLGFSGSVIAVNLLTILASSETLHGRGPFLTIPEVNEAYRIAVLQLFLTMSMLMSMPIGVALLQRQEFEQELKEAYAQVEEAAMRDGLTGVVNRRRFDVALSAEWRRAKREEYPLGLLMVDVDYFKKYNDTYGHLAGDECLRRVAQTLLSVPLRAVDLVARYGGEEFAVLLPGGDEAGVKRVGEAIREAVEALEIAHRGSPRGRVTVSIGCGTLIPDVVADAETLIECADQALYEAKQTGRNCTRAARSRSGMAP
jgi:diguanylate cyclase (GGDEF)-like protein